MKDSCYILHHNDDDGRAAAYLVCKYLKSLGKEILQPIECNYSNKNEYYCIDSIDSDDSSEVWIVDYSIEPNLMRDLMEKTNKIIWIDHHISSIRKYENFESEIPGYRIDGVAGCMLTYQYIENLKNLSGNDIIPSYDSRLFSFAPKWLQYIAKYDVWDLDMDTIYFHYGFECVTNKHPLSETWKYIDEAKEDPSIEFIRRGKIIKDYKVASAKYQLENAFISKISDTICYCVNTQGVSSLDIENIKFAEEIEAFAIFYYDGALWHYSLRSLKPDVDVSKIAENYGGGGHKSAAGFTSTNLIF